MEAGAKVEAGTGGSAQVGGATVSGSVEATAQTGLFIEGSASADKSGLDASFSVADGTMATVTGTTGVEMGDGSVSASGTVTVMDGTFVDGSLAAGTGGVAIGGSAAIGTAVGVEGSVTSEGRYNSGTVGSGVSIGEQFAAGGGAEATYSKGVVTVGVSGDVAALIGIDVDVSGSINVRAIASDATKAATIVEHEAPKVADAVVSTGKKTGDAIVSGGKTATNAIVSGGKKAGNSIKKAFHL
jgi:hypothetical protein